MKSNVMPSIVRIDKESLKSLMAETKETLAQEFNLQQSATNKKFGIVDLWNCQKSVRTAASRRSFFNS